jgi:tripartite-type tricarboxylate transporter receptor subunit TctC
MTKKLEELFELPPTADEEPAAVPPAETARQTLAALDDSIDKINAAIQEATKDKEVQAKLAQLGFVIWPSKNPQDFAQYVSDQMAYWGKLIIQSGIKSELN